MSTKGKSKAANYRDPLILLVCVIIGGVLGMILGEKASIIKPIGQIFINLLFCLVVPLVFFSISSSIASVGDAKRVGKLLGSTMGVFVSTAVIAGVLMMTLTHFLPYATGIVLDSGETGTMAEINFGDHIVGMFTVSDFPELLSRSHVLPLIIFAVFLGCTVSSMGEKGKPIAEGLNSIAGIFYKMISILMKVAPIGLAAYFADLTGTYGSALMGTYFHAIIMYYPTLLLYMLIFFTIYTFIAAGRPGVKAYFKNILTPALTALGTRSSAAAIPGQLEACDKIGVPREVSSVVVPMGATCHMDGSCMSSIFKIAVMCYVFNRPLTGIKDFAFAFFVAVCSSVAMSSVPGGGAISETMIISLFGFPVEGLPICIMLSQLCDAATTLVNSSGDTAASMLVTRILYGKDWLSKNLSGKQE